MGLTKARITNKETRETITCLFNPTEYTISKQNAWQSKPVVGKNVPKLDFTGGGAQQLTMDLFFDVFEDAGKDVAAEIQKLMKLTLIHPKPTNDKTKKSRPPLCIFEWGPKWSFTAVVMNLKVRYTLFREDGTPARATASITLQEAEDDTQQKKQNPTSFSEAGSRRREVRPRDTLAGIAYEEYGDPNRWRDIATTNEIDDPLGLRPGQILVIPPRG
jgi:hypothetical protein